MLKLKIHPLLSPKHVLLPLAQPQFSSIKYRRMKLATLREITTNTRSYLRTEMELLQQGLFIRYPNIFSPKSTDAHCLLTLFSLFLFILTQPQRTFSDQARLNNAFFFRNCFMFGYRTDMKFCLKVSNK